jgi:hypothetical protein
MNAEQYRALVNKLEQINEKVTLNPDGTVPPIETVTLPNGATIVQRAKDPAAPTTPVVGDIKQTPVVGTPLPAPAPAPVKSQANYNMALQQIKSLYAKAQVAYPPQDDIVRTRFGLPPALPPFEQWDGKMPQAGEADFLTRNVFGRQASKDIAQQNTANTISATSGAQVDQNNIANVAKLKDLVAKLTALSAPAPAAQSSQAPAAAPAGTMSAESNDLRSALAKMLKEDFNIDMAEAGEDKQALIKQIQDLIAQINGDNENPEPEVAQALQDAQAAIDAANTAQAEKEKQIGANQDQEDADMGAAMTANAQAEKEKQIGANQDAEDQAMGQAMTANTTPPAPQSGQATFGQAFKTARASGAKEFEYKGKKYSTAQKGENPALDAAMAKQKPTAPTAPTAPSKPVAPQSGQAGGLNAPKLQTGNGPTQIPSGAPTKPSVVKRPTAESVGYQEDQTLARIVSLANIR